MLKLRTFACALLCILALSPLLRAQPLTAATAGAVPATAQDEQSLREIGDLRAGLVDAFNKKDLDKMLTYLHPDVIVTWQNGEVSKGREAVRKYYSRMMIGDDRICESVTAAPEIEGRVLNGDTSISYGHMNDVFKLRDGSKFRLDSRFSAWLVRDNGRWLVRGFHLSGNIFDNEIQSAMVHKSVLWTAIGAGIGGLVLGWLLGRIFTRKSSPRA